MTDQYLSEPSITNDMFDYFYDRVYQYFVGSGHFLIKDEATFKTLIHTFYYIAVKERLNILMKEKADERFKISKLTEKALS